MLTTFIFVAVLAAAMSSDSRSASFTSVAQAEQEAGLGDADCDGGIDSTDALAILRYTAQLDTTAQCIDYSDANCDEEIDAVDALALLRHVAGLPRGATGGACPELNTAGYELTVEKFAKGTVTLSPKRSECGLDCTSIHAPFVPGTEVVLTATPAEGYELFGWEGCDSDIGPTCSVTLGSDKFVLVTFKTTELIVQDTTKVLDEATMQLLVRIEGDTYYFSSQAGVVAALEPGDVIVSHQFLRKVLSVSVGPEEIAVATEQARLADAISKGSVVLSTQDSSLSTWPQQIQSASSGCTWSQFKCEASFEEEVSENITVSGSASLDFDLDIAADFDWGLLGPYVDSALVVAGLQGHGDLTVKIDQDFNWQKETSIPLGSTWISFTIGPVPVSIELEAELKIGVKGTAKVGTKASGRVDFNGALGGRYDDNTGWDLINEWDADASYTLPELRGNADIRVYAKPVLNAKLYGIAGPQLGFGPHVRAHANLLEGPWWSLYFGLSADVNLNLDLGIKELSKTWPVWEHEWLLAQDLVETPTPSPVPGAPTISSVSHSPYDIFEDPCSPGATTVRIEVSDDQGVQSVSVAWYFDDGGGGQALASPTPPHPGGLSWVDAHFNTATGKWHAVIDPPWALSGNQGTVRYYVRATDTLGNSSKSPLGDDNYEIDVLKCSSPPVIESVSHDTDPIYDGCDPAYSRVRAVVSDPNGVADVWIRWRNGEEADLAQPDWNWRTTTHLASGEWEGVLTAPDLAAGLASGSVDYYVEAMDGLGNISHNPGDSRYYYTIEVLGCASPTPGTGPAITMVEDAPDPVYDGCDPRQANVWVTASDPDGLASIEVIWRTYDGESFSAWIASPMTKPLGQKWQAVIDPPPLSPGASSGFVQYYIEARDGLGNISRSPSTTDEYYTIDLLGCEQPSTPTPTPSPTPMPDLLGPDISQVADIPDPIWEGGCSPDTTTVTVYASDPSGVQSVTVHWRLFDGNSFGAWQESAATFSGFPLFRWGAQINPPDLAAGAASGYVQYYVRAADSRGNTSRFPALNPPKPPTYLRTDVLACIDVD